MGTANNISRSFGLVDRSLQQLIDGWSEARSRWIDLGIIEGPWGTEYFIEGVGAGLFTRTMLEIDRYDALGHLDTPQEKIESALAILGERLRSFPVRQMNLRLDGKDLSGEYLMMEAMNIHFVGPNLFVAPDCDPADGMLDVVLISEKERRSLLLYLASWQRGALKAPELPTYRGEHVQLVWNGGTLHIDDTTWPPAGTEAIEGPAVLDIRVRKHALHVLVPA